MDRRTRRELLERLTTDARRIAGHFGLEYRALEAERANVKRRYGVCYDDGTIKIRLNHAATGEPLKYSSLVNTLCHELAHLRHFNHGQRFQAFYRRVLGHARDSGIYRPDLRRRAPRPVLETASRAEPRSREPAPALPTQLELF